MSKTLIPIANGRSSAETELRMTALTGPWVANEHADEIVSPTIISKSSLQYKAMTEVGAATAMQIPQSFRHDAEPPPNRLANAPPAIVPTNPDATKTIPNVVVDDATLQP